MIGQKLTLNPTVCGSTSPTPPTIATNAAVNPFTIQISGQMNQSTHQGKACHLAA